MPKNATSEFLHSPARLLAFTFLFVVILALGSNFLQPRQLDFISFWAASQLVLQGTPIAAYDIHAHAQVQAAVGSFDALMPFVYPPPFLLLVSPLALLPFTLAAPLWVAGTFAIYLTAARKLVAKSEWLVIAFPPVLLNGMTGQNGFVTAAIFIGGFLLLPKRPLLAGIVLGCLVIKPQLALLIPIAFVAGRQWHAFAGAAASSLFLLLLGWLAFGIGSYKAMAELLPLFGSIASDGGVGWHKMATVYASLRLVGLPAQVAWSAHSLIAAISAAMLWRIWRGPYSLSAKSASLAAAATLVSPYLYIYDTLVLIVPALWLLVRGKNLPLIIVLWCIPLFSIGQSWGFNDSLNLMPIVPIMMLLLIYRTLVTSSAGSDEPVDAAPHAPALRQLS